MSAWSPRLIRPLFSASLSSVPPSVKHHFRLVPPKADSVSFCRLVAGGGLGGRDGGLTLVVGGFQLFIEPESGDWNLAVLRSPRRGFIYGIPRLLRRSRGAGRLSVETVAALLLSFCKVMQALFCSSLFVCFSVIFFASRGFPSHWPLLFAAGILNGIGLLLGRMALGLLVIGVGRLRGRSVASGTLVRAGISACHLWLCSLCRGVQVSGGWLSADRSLASHSPSNRRYLYQGRLDSN